MISRLAARSSSSEREEGLIRSRKRKDRARDPSGLWLCGWCFGLCMRRQVCFGDGLLWHWALFLLLASATAGASQQ
jgi:hypothetical protein